mmetsp:Transcript_61964/g.166287  ORF Transcript_61964/g.166287 Transcript_61964/m.166287 type:complete len:106 (+) Transcript_61964:630-947(+)
MKVLVNSCAPEHMIAISKTDESTGESTGHDCYLSSRWQIIILLLLSYVVVNVQAQFSIVLGSKQDVLAASVETTPAVLPNAMGSVDAWRWQVSSFSKTYQVGLGW